MIKNLTNKAFKPSTLLVIAVTTHVNADQSCLDGLFAIDRKAEAGQSSLYHIDLTNKTYSPLADSAIAVSNLAANNDTLIMFKRLDSETNESKIY
tara:strand:- start:318 stop:602 length:285 start_codon:yes stop_codon:yes gene_type:complete